MITIAAHQDHLQGVAIVRHVYLNYNRWCVVGSSVITHNLRSQYIYVKEIQQKATQVIITTVNG